MCRCGTRPGSPARMSHMHLLSLCGLKNGCDHQYAVTVARNCHRRFCIQLWPTVAVADHAAVAHILTALKLVICIAHCCTRCQVDTAATELHVQTGTKFQLLTTFVCRQPGRPPPLWSSRCEAAAPT